MGDRGYNAGGFAYMTTVTCPNCGCRRPLGKDAVEAKRFQCGNKTRCEERRRSGHFLHRLTPNA